jgi:hypothetical protein
MLAAVHDADADETDAGEADVGDTDVDEAGPGLESGAGVTAQPLLLIAYTVWLAAAIAGFGAGPALVLLRAGRLPAQLYLPVTFLIAAAVSYGVWCAYVIDPAFGRACSVAAWLASAGAFAWLVTRATDAPAHRAMLRSRAAWLPGALMLALTLAYLCLLSARATTANDRFTWPLPPDNDIPRLLAARVEEPSASRPHGFLLGDWLTSDRPPLQSGIVLAVKPFDYSAYVMLTYQIAGTIGQMTWVLAAFALARTIGLSRHQTACVLIACASSGFFLLHSIYVWPKLLSASLLLTAVAILFCLERDRTSPRVAWPLMAGALALSALAHGGTFFSLLALPVLAALLRVWRRADLTSWAAATCVGALLVAPWLVYQRVVDPPGNRLTKMHLAGMEPIDSRGLVEAMADEYGKLTLSGYLRGRLQNVASQLAGAPRAPDETLADWARRQQFFHHAAALDFLVFGLLGLCVRPRGDGGSRSGGAPREEVASFRRLRALAIFAVASLAVWILLMFTPGSAVIHQGSFATTVLLFFCGAAGLARWARPVQLAVLGGHAAIFAWAWLFTTQVSRGVPVLPLHPVFVAASVVWGLLFLSLLPAIPEG